MPKGVTWEVRNTVNVLAGSVKLVSLEKKPLALVILEASWVILIGLRTTSSEGRRIYVC